MPTKKRLTNRQFSLGILICSIGTLFYCYEFILRILPGILQNELVLLFGNIPASVFGGMTAFYYFAYAPMQVPVGILMDRFGPRLLLTFACICCTIGTMLFMDYSSLWVSSVGRFLVGFGSSFAFVGVLTLSVHWLPPKYFSLVAGLITTLGMIGIVFGEIQITHLSVQYGVNYIFDLLVILGAILSVVIFLVVRNGPHVSFLKTESWSKFFKNVWHVFSIPEIWVIGAVGAFLYTSLSVFGELWGKTYLEQAHHLSKVESAQTISILFIGWAIGAPLAGFLSDFTGRRVIPLVIGAFFSLICISTILYSNNLSYSLLNILMFFYGLFSATEIIVFAMARESVRIKLSSTVFAVINMIIMLGGVFFQPLVGKLLDVFSGPSVAPDVHFYTVEVYQLALSVLPVSLLLVMILAFFLKDYRKN